MTRPATIRGGPIRTATRALVWTGWIPDASRPSGRLRAARQILAESPWASATLERDPAGIPRIRAGAGSAPAAAQPAVTGPQDSRAAVSWSCCGDELAVVIADVGPVGIDLEVITGRTPPERELALVLRHAQVRMRPPGCDAWCEWTAVEALAKAARRGLIGLITGRVLVIGRGTSSKCDPPRTGVEATICQGPPTALFTVTTRNTRGGDADPEPDRHDRWQIRHHHNGSRRLSVVVPD